MTGDVASVKAQLDLALNELEDLMATLHHAKEKSESATGGLLLTLEGTGDAEVSEVAAITSEITSSIETQIDSTAIAMERIRAYYARL